MKTYFLFEWASRGGCEIKLGEDVEYVLKDEGMQLKCEGVGQVIHEGLENLS